MNIKERKRSYSNQIVHRHHHHHRCIISYIYIYVSHCTVDYLQQLNDREAREGDEVPKQSQLLIYSNVYMWRVCVSECFHIYEAHNM